MRSAYKIFKGTSGIEDVLVRANEFVNRVGREHLIGINTVIDPKCRLRELEAECREAPLRKRLS